MQCAARHGPKASRHRHTHTHTHSNHTSKTHTYSYPHRNMYTHTCTCTHKHIEIFTKDINNVVSNTLKFHLCHNSNDKFLVVKWKVSYLSEVDLFTRKHTLTMCLNTTLFSLQYNKEHQKSDEQWVCKGVNASASQLLREREREKKVSERVSEWRREVVRRWESKWGRWIGVWMSRYCISRNFHTELFFGRFCTAPCLS